MTSNADTTSDTYTITLGDYVTVTGSDTMAVLQISDERVVLGRPEVLKLAGALIATETMRSVNEAEAMKAFAIAIENVTNVRRAVSENRTVNLDKLPNGRSDAERVRDVARGAMKSAWRGWDEY